MSSLKVHTLQSIVTSAALYPVIGANVLPFGLAVIFIDLDHIVEYVRDTRSLDVHGVFSYSKLIEINLDKNYLVLSAFHTVEFFALVYVLSLFYPFCIYVLAGLAYHMLFDFAHLLRFRQFFCRAIFLAEYFYRKKYTRSLTSIYQILPLEDLKTAGIPHIEAWRVKWLASRYGKPADNV
ncbi:MAG: hypothetical protein WCQ99_07455 [Pseudomonadota bacterium]